MIISAQVIMGGLSFRLANRCAVRQGVHHVEVLTLKLVKGVAAVLNS